MTKLNRRDNAEIQVKALERILSKGLSYDERIYFENKHAQAQAKLEKAQLAMLSPRQKRIDALFATGAMK